MRGRLLLSLLCVLIVAPLCGRTQTSASVPDLPPIGAPPGGTAPYFEALRVEFTPENGAAIDLTKTLVSVMVYAAPSPGAFKISVVLLRNDGQLAPSGEGGLGPSGGGFGYKPNLLPRDVFFRKGDTLNALLLAQFSFEPTAFRVRTPDTPRCFFVNCVPTFRADVAWQHVHYRRFIPLQWRLE